jgi:NitT/TauT family transport system substrate-binding protein
VFCVIKARRQALNLCDFLQTDIAEALQRQRIHSKHLHKGTLMFGRDENTSQSGGLTAAKLSRRCLLSGAAALTAGTSLGGLAAYALPFAARAPEIDFTQFPICRVGAEADALPGPPHKFKISWNAGSVCLTPVAVAIEKGFFAKYNLDAELINYSGSTDQLLEAIATGKSDAGVGMALRWLKPLEQGFDVKITAGTHGGCMRVLAPMESAISDIKGLKGKVVAVSDLASPGKNFFSIVLQKNGVDPVSEVEWRQYPGNLLRLAVEKGEAAALIDGDPNTYLWLKDKKLKEIASNLDGEYKERTCCILGVRGSLIREDPRVARAITLGLLDATMWTSQNPQEAAKVFAPYAANASVEDITSMIQYHTHHHHPVGDALKAELKAYADELKLVSVFKPGTNTAKFAERIYADVLSA